jgi:PAS domain S-box-containing protein
LLKTRQFDVVLSDFNIAGFEGLQVLAAVRAHDPYLPVIIVTGTGSEEVAAQALKQGASDYVIKRPKHILRLPQTILAVIEKRSLREQRRKAEISLRESERRYRSLFANMINGCFYCRMLFEREEARDFIFVEVNQAFETLTGLKDVLGKRASDVMPGVRESDAGSFDVLGRVVRTGAPQAFEIHILIQDRDLRYLWVLNPQLGLTEEEMLGKTDFDLLGAEDAALLTGLKRRVLETGNRESVKVPLVSRQGDLQYFEGVYTPKRDEKGVIDGLIGYFRNVTDRVEAEKAIRRSEARYRTLVNTIPDLVWLKDPEGVYLGCNPSFERFFGAEESEILGKTDYDFNDKELADSFREHDRKAMEADGPRVNEGWRTFAHDGYRGLFETIKTPMRDPDGNLVGVLGIARDITARKKTEVALRESEDKYRSLFEGSSDGIFLTMPDGTITDVNPSACRMLNMSKEEICRAGRDAILEKDENLVSSLQARERSGTFSGELTFVRPDGSRFVADTTSVIISRKSGSRRAVAIVRDVTERKLAEKTLRDSETRFRTLVENIPQGVLLKDRQSNYLSINQAYAGVYGIRKEDVVGKSDYDFHSREYADRSRREDRAVMESGESMELKEEYVKDGRKRFLHRVKVPARDSAGKITGVLTTVADVTDRVRMEEQLHHSQKMEAVGRLAGGVAHDFNNLLTVIGGYSDIALGKMPEEDPLRENLQEIRTATTRASNLTRQLLAFSRRQVAETRVIDLAGVLREMEKMLRRLLGEDVRLITRLPESLWRVKADPGQIEQVLSNLAINARDAMPDGGTIVIAAENLELSVAGAHADLGLTPGRFVRLSVSDTGTGMDAEVLARIFEPFFTTKESGKGTVLGLSMVFGIVKQSGGEIRVRSEPGAGTTFEIYLPQVDEAALASGQEEQRPVLKGTETVLVIEDERALRTLVVQILRHQGYQVLEASDGGGALLKFENHPGPIDLVLTDVVMPGSRGPAVVERLKKVKEDFKVLYMSGYTDNEISYADMLRRGDHFIPKPFTPESLVSRIRGVLDGDG